MKCSICNKIKGKRFCAASNSMVCSYCCGSSRNYEKCDTTCDYFGYEDYTLLESNSVKFTVLDNGRVICFSESLFLPNLSDYIKVDISSFKINIKNPILVSVEIVFILKSTLKRTVKIDEIYYADGWKRKSSSFPFLQLYTINCGEVSNICLKENDLDKNVVVENNHLDTWLPFSYSVDEKLSFDEIKKRGLLSEVTSKFCYGKHFEGKNNTFFSNLDFEKDYTLKFDVKYDSLHSLDDKIAIPLGFLFPFKYVIFNKHIVNLLSDFEISGCSKIQFFLPFEHKVESSQLIPLGRNNILSSSKCGNIDYKCLDNKFYFDDYVIFNYLFTLDFNKELYVNASFSDIPIFSGLYNSFNALYNNDYAPVNITLYNSSNKIKKCIVRVVIQDISYEYINEVYIEPKKIENIKIAPQLIDTKIDEISSNSYKNIYVKVIENDMVIFNSTNSCVIYPKDIFVEIIRNNRLDWEIDFRIFLARWVTPSVKEIDELLSNVSSSGSLLGSTTKNMNEIENEIKRIYDYLSDMKYVIRSLSFSESDYHTQRISFPSKTYKLKSGNCIDLSLLLASCFEALKLKTYICLIPGHAFVRVKLNDNYFICIESTLLGKAEYYEATESGRNKYYKYFGEDESHDNDCYILDISLARKNKIFPMSC